MSKARLLALIGIFGATVILAAGFPLSRVKADHCHPAQGQTQAAGPQTPDPGLKTPVRNRESAITSPRTTRAQSRPASSIITPATAATASIEQIYSRDLPLVIQSLGQAVKAVESGDRQTELAELNKAVTMLATIHEALGKHVKAPSTPSVSFGRGSAGVPSAVEGPSSTPSATGVGASGSPGADGSRAQSRDLVNSRCPIMGSAIKPESVTANLTRDYKGQKIGFCCAGCPSAWDKLTDAQKQAKLSAVKS